MDVFTLNEFNEKIEKILPVDEDGLVSQDLGLQGETINRVRFLMTSRKRLITTPEIRM